MKALRTVLSVAVLGLAGVGTSLDASAGVIVSCPNTVSTTDREHKLETDVASTCLLSGNGNLQGDTGVGSDFFTLSAAGAGYAILDKDTGTALPGIESKFWLTDIEDNEAEIHLDASLWSLYSKLAVGFVVGERNPGPRWAVFGLANGTLEGEWKNEPRQGGGLSHAILYGVKKTTTQVPEPGTLALLGLGLAGLGIARRKRAA